MGANRTWRHRGERSHQSASWASCHTWAGTLTPMPMPMLKTVYVTNMYNKKVQLEVCTTFSGKVWVWISQLNTGARHEAHSLPPHSLSVPQTERASNSRSPRDLAGVVGQLSWLLRIARRTLSTEATNISISLSLYIYIYIYTHILICTLSISRPISPWFLWSILHYRKYDDDACSEFFPSQEQNDFRSCCP